MVKKAQGNPKSPISWGLQTPEPDGAEPRLKLSPLCTASARHGAVQAALTLMKELWETGSTRRAPLVPLSIQSAQSFQVICLICSAKPPVTDTLQTPLAICFSASLFLLFNNVSSCPASIFLATIDAVEKSSFPFFEIVSL